MTLLKIEKAYLRNQYRSTATNNHYENNLICSTLVWISNYQTFDLPFGRPSSWWLYKINVLSIGVKLWNQ